MDYSITCTGGQPDWKFSYVKGIFQNERHPTGPAAGFRAETLPNLGILNRSYGLDDNLDASAAKTQWQNLASFLAYLNSHKNGVRYKLLYVARHGEGVHNVKERQIGRHEWEVSVSLDFTIVTTIELTPLISGTGRDLTASTM